ncbi:uncharacterized protein LOC125831548 [Solanum verrucosum]|uniref:uncharacterized protein LOC125831548 n=1 Tax=Solanum verrucosum TaxID=315347 RepID=UPI0020D0462F|nr:uncharacterized protein LOC125831548 [Solanum verrucosum]
MEDEEAALAYDQAALTMRGPLAHMSMGKICSRIARLRKRSRPSLFTLVLIDTCSLSCIISLEGEGAAAAEETKKSNHVLRKIEKRLTDRKLDSHLEEQFSSGRLYACISSRPGQCGRGDGYILEGKELEFQIEEGEGAAAAEETKKSNHVLRKIEKRLTDRKLDSHLEEQFSSGRLYACISSRPGQCGRGDGYILEGKELEFYMKKLQKKKGKAAAA